MGEENRGSSGSSTAMIVIAILGGLLVVGCCGGVLVMGLGLIRLSVRQDFENVVHEQATEVVESAPEVQKALDEMHKELEPLQIPLDDLTEPARTDPGIPKESPDAAPEPGVELKKE